MEKGSEGRRQVIEAARARYRATRGRAERQRILDSVERLTGYHRKHVIRRMAGAGDARSKTKRTRVSVYDDAVREALVVLWEASDRICGKRLKPLLPVLLPALERHGHVRFEEQVRARLLSVSAATIDRLLVSQRNAGREGRRRRSKATSAVR